MMKKNKKVNKFTIQLILTVFIFSTLLLLSSCGGQEAPFGYTIKSQQSSLGAPRVGDSNCFSGGNGATFLVLDNTNTPVAGIQVDVTSGFQDAYIAVHDDSSPTDCSNVVLGVNSARTSSDPYGRIRIDFLVDLTTVPTTSAGQTYFISLQSGGSTGALLKTAPSSTL